MSIILKKSRIAAFSILTLYLLVRFVFFNQVDAFGPYASYIFEGTFTLLVIFLYRSHLKLKFPFSKSFLAQLVLALILGFGVYRLANTRGFVIPFDLNNRETILFLLLIGPILEEFLFRQALWSSLQILADNRLVAFVGTSVLFVFGHYFAYFFVPDSLRPFVLYQTGYVLIISFWWGASILKSGSILKTIFYHLTFNLGFFLGFKSLIFV
jgi:membrane protease YdiL (CAAX protease family)